jgi:hypothetical protein
MELTEQGTQKLEAAKARNRDREPVTLDQLRDLVERTTTARRD